MPVDEYNMVASHGQIRVEQDRVKHDRVHEMINNAFKVQGGIEQEQYFDEAPNEKARRFYDQLEESSRPLCEWSPHSALSVEVRLMNIKSDWNVPNAAMDSMIDLLDHIGRESGVYYSYYFGDDVSCRRNRPNHNDEGDIDPLFTSISIFN
ncbi:hypothetical protein H5410_036778 [Solanum commersonii]|uniref:Uncharacterized protein n=1 Tax=Solanum commersonii TaxID=4109 RepID=A0A9J5Y679_SOLCO|nr:hypothetical protein H5410_036778 [Solanum commersonii]